MANSEGFFSSVESFAGVLLLSFVGVFLLSEGLKVDSLDGVKVLDGVTLLISLEGLSSGWQSQA